MHGVGVRDVRITSVPAYVLKSLHAGGWRALYARNTYMLKSSRSCTQHARGKVVGHTVCVWEGGKVVGCWRTERVGIC